MALREVIASFTTQVDDAPLRKGEKAIDGFQKSLSDAMKVVSGAVLFNTAKTELLSFAEEINNIADTSERLGVTAQALQELQYVAKRTGSGAEAVNKALMVLSKQAGDNAKEIEALTGKLSDVDKNDPAALFLKVGFAIAEQETAAERTASAMKVFGKAGAELVPIFNRGKPALEDLTKRFRRLGGALDDETIDAIGELENSFDNAEIAWRKLKGDIGRNAIPVIAGLINATNEGASSFTDMAKQTNVLQSALVVLGGAAGIAGLALAAPFAPFILAAAAAILVVDEFQTMLAGGETAISSLISQIEKLFGHAEATQTVMHDIAQGWTDLKKSIDERGVGQGLLDKGAETDRNLRVRNLKANMELLNQLEREGKGFAWSQSITGEREVWRGEMGALGDLGIGGEAQYAKAGTMSEADRKKAFDEARAWIQAGIDEANPTLQKGRVRNAFKSAEVSREIDTLRDLAGPAVVGANVRGSRNDAIRTGLSVVGAPFAGAIAPVVGDATANRKVAPTTITIDAKTTNHISANAEAGGELGGAIAESIMRTDRARTEGLKNALTTVGKK